MYQPRTRNVEPTLSLDSVFNCGEAGRSRCDAYTILFSKFLMLSHRARKSNEYYSHQPRKLLKPRITSLPPQVLCMVLPPCLVENYDLTFHRSIDGPSVRPTDDCQGRYAESIDRGGGGGEHDTTPYSFFSQVFLFQAKTRRHGEIAQNQRRRSPFRHRNSSTPSKREHSQSAAAAALCGGAMQFRNPLSSLPSFLLSFLPSLHGANSTREQRLAASPPYVKCAGVDAHISRSKLALCHIKSLSLHLALLVQMFYYAETCEVTASPLSSPMQWVFPSPPHD